MYGFGKFAEVVLSKSELLRCVLMGQKFAYLAWIVDMKMHFDMIIYLTNNLSIVDNGSK